MNSMRQFIFVKDPADDIPLAEVVPVSLKIWTLFSRNREKPILDTNFLNLYGTVDMVSGLEYHYANFKNAVSRLSELPSISDETRNLEHSLRHEVIAYLNRMGQFYHFVNSDFVTKRISNVWDFIPTIIKFKIFRDKHGAHRSIDYPYGEDYGIQQGQAWQLSSVGGLLFSPKENSKKPNNMDDLVNPKRQWTQNYLCFQMQLDKDKYLNFCIEQEHLRIIAEAFKVVETLIELDQIVSATR